MILTPSSPRRRCLARYLALALLLLLSLSCRAAKRPFDPSTMVAPSPDASADYRESLTLEEIEGLEPQLRFPIVLAVSQPSSGRGWSREEIAIIEGWETPLRASGFLEHLVILPEALSSSCGYRMSYHCGIERNRRAAARFHADALLLVSAQTEVDSFANAAAFLNATTPDA